MRDEPPSVKVDEGCAFTRERWPIHRRSPRDRRVGDKDRRTGANDLRAFDQKIPPLRRTRFGSPSRVRLAAAEDGQPRSQPTVTITPARGPIVLDEWISPGTHIAAVGADKGGDQELESRILQRARIFVDDIRQCRTDGEINVPLAEGLISEDDIAGEIGKVIVGKLPGRTSDDEITVFDSTGIALQDSATVPLEYERALAAGVGIEKKMIST